MNEQREFIDVVELRRVPTVREFKDAFEFCKDRPAHWLQKLCLWTLRKLGCYASLETVEVQRHHIGKNGKRFMDRLWQRRSAMQGTLDMDPTRLLIGSEEYAELMNEAVSNTAFDFNTEYYKGNGPGRQPTVMGLHVEVIPWMRGMLLLR